MSKSRQRGLVHVRGNVWCRDAGRSQIVFGRRCLSERLEHEVWLTEAELLIGVAFDRDVCAGRAVADAGFDRDGARFFVEVDNSTMTSAAMRAKWERYELPANAFVLVIAHTTARLRTLMRSAETVRHAALFARFAWLRLSNVKEKWIDSYGRRAAV